MLPNLTEVRPLQRIQPGLPKARDPEIRVHGLGLRVSVNHFEYIDPLE